MASAEAVVRRCSARKGVSQILQENTGVFFNKKYNFIKKETPPPGAFLWILQKNFKNTYFEEYLPTAARRSVIPRTQDGILFTNDWRM